MTKDTDHTGSETGEVKLYPSSQCRFAYTINNIQPVRCTWISDQPLFYADDLSVEDDDDILNDPAFKALEKDIADMSAKTMAYEKVSRQFLEADAKKQDRLMEDLAFITGAKKTKTFSLAKLLDRITVSRTASTLLSFAQLNKIRVEISNAVSSVSYDRMAQVIFVRDDLSVDQQILLLARELRRMWQHKNGAGLHPLMLHPDHAVLFNRTRDADLAIAMVRIAWELQLAGDKDAWQRIENSSLSDLGRSFAREACNNFRSLNDGKAARAAFETWFLSERCRKSDRILIQQMLADYNGYVFTDNPDASRSITIDLLRALGQMPFGTNYLSAHIAAIMNDTVFTDVRDRSNANFLWFIKFERAVRDVETALEDDAKASSSNTDSGSDVVFGQVIAFPVPSVSQKRAKASQGGSSSEIVPLDAKKDG
jgi:hypothetical protein